MTSFSFKRTLLMATVAIVVSGSAHRADAAGFYIQEQSVQGLGAAFSGSASNLHDPSTIYFNPAGMSQLSGTQMQAGAHLLVPTSKINDRGTTAPATATLGGKSGNPYDPTPVPNGFISAELGHGFWGGIGITAPFGLANEYKNGWFGRFDSTKTELTVIDVQPTIAYKINDMISIGAGVNFQHSDADLQNKVMLGAATEGTSRLTGDDWGYGYSFGIQIKPIESTTIGLNYKSEVHHHLDGQIRVTNDATGAIVGAGTTSTPGTAKLTTPDHLTLGISHKVNDRWTVQGQATWFGWNNFDNITAIRDSGAQASRVDQNYQTTWAFAAGAEYAYSDAWTFRGGVQFDETPTTDLYRTSRTPDGDRTWLSLGATYNVTPAWDVDMAATYIFIKDEDINLTRATATGNAVIRGETEGSVGILALAATYKF